MSTATARPALPHETELPFLTDGGLETTLVFLDGVDLPCFAAFPLLAEPNGRERLRQYYRAYAQMAVERGLGFILESPTWRANPDWSAKLGLEPEALAAANRDAIALMHEVRAEFAGSGLPMPISGCLGPRGDGYQVGATMSAEEAAAYHAPQIRTYRDAGADLVSAITMTYTGEALGIANAAAEADILAVISFTVETDGRLPSGETLQSAVEQVDRKAARLPAYYMVNCAHPTHFAGVLSSGAPWLERIRGVRANASCRSHAELDASTDLDAGDPAELGRQYRELQRVLPRLTVYGGCCGTDERHIRAIRDTCLATLHASK